MKKWFTAILAAVSFAAAHAQSVSENFADNPLDHGWKIAGDQSLFQWDRSAQNLRVTWNSARQNSYFYKPLHTILATNDDFALSFDLRLSDIAIGTTSNAPFTFQIAIGFLNIAQATNANFVRGSGFEAPNLAEFNFFPDSGFGNTISTPIISSNNSYASGGFTVGLEITPNDLFRVTMRYSASNQTLATIMMKNGQPFGPVADTVLGENFSDFRVDAVSVSSYNDAGQDPNYAGSILAHGTIDNFSFTVPDSRLELLPPDQASPAFTFRFNADPAWVYQVQRTTNLTNWTDLGAPVKNASGAVSIEDAASSNAFYRLKADRP